MRTRPPIVHLSLIAVFALSAQLLGTTQPALSHPAGSASSAAAATATLPSRPTRVSTSIPATPSPPPTVAPTVAPTARPWATPAPLETRMPTAPRVRSEAPTGAWIELRPLRAPMDAWTGVQWQDALGGWHDVEGWQGDLDEAGKVWWVAPGDFGTGPFRWLLLDSRGGKVLAASEPFHLPDENGEVVVIFFALPPAR